ncbi:MAG TPA: CpsD/CapB family tyrosine-protein kinase [Terriglobales bacterium]|nr:CpsD/CapB family tyrosine-protein kinase [Terriglobales bacterium]
MAFRSHKQQAILEQEEDVSKADLHNPQSRHLSQVTDSAYPLITDSEQLAAAEHFGVLRTRILSAHARNGIRAVLLTSAQPEEGKSLISTNLAISLAQMEKYKILLADGDLRVRGITRLFKLQDKAGIGEFLSGSASFDSVVCGSGLPCLSLAGAGNVPPESLAGLLQGEKWSEFIKEAKQRFDLIIVDSVPVVAPIADFELLQAACDGLLLIVHLHKTDRHALDRTVQQMNGKLLGLVINNAEPEHGDNYYSYYYGRQKKAK